MPRVSAHASQSTPSYPPAAINTNSMSPRISSAYIKVLTKKFFALSAAVATFSTSSAVLPRSSVLPSAQFSRNVPLSRTSAIVELSGVVRDGVPKNVGDGDSDALHLLRRLDAILRVAIGPVHQKGTVVAHLGDGRRVVAAVGHVG